VSPIVVFLSSDYHRKDWRDIEFRAIDDIISIGASHRIVLVRTDAGDVDRISKADGYLDARKFAPAEIARFIHDRLFLL
jgi:hypothetical protein